MRSSRAVFAVLLALAASASWGVADFVAGLTSRRLSALLVLLGQQAIGALVVLAIVVATGEGAPEQRALVLSVLAGAAGAVALGAFYRALAVGTMSVVAPISASGVTIPVAVGLATGDELSTIVGVGLVLTVAGILLASREAGEDAEALATQRRAVLLALVAAAGFGTFFLTSDAAADESVLWLLLVSRTTATLLLVGAVVAVRGLPVPAPRDVAIMGLIGCLDLLATALYAVANTEGQLSVVSVVGSLYPVATVLLAWIVLHERLQRVQAIGVALAVTGVLAVAGGA